ncbi:MAG: hypothetical protein EHM19_06390, partial [Candidatus Latescibacterota bacterium]
MRLATLARFASPFALLAFAALLLAPSWAAAGASAEPRGLTTPPAVLIGDWEPDPLGTARAASAEIAGEAPAAAAASARDDSLWELIQADSFLARIPAGEAMSIYVDYLAETFTVSLPAEAIIARAFDAIDYAPGWLAEDLRDVFSRIDSATQDTLAGLILGTD